MRQAVVLSHGIHKLVSSQSDSDSESESDSASDTKFPAWTMAESSKLMSSSSMSFSPFEEEGDNSQTGDILEASINSNGEVEVTTTRESILGIERVPAEMRSMGRDAFTIHVRPPPHDHYWHTSALLLCARRKLVSIP